MKIALFTSNRTIVPPPPGVIAASAYLTGLLADMLVEAGHDVTLYAPKGSMTKARIIDLDLPPSDLDYALHPEEWVKNMSLGMKQRYLSQICQDSDQYDIIHLQTEPIYLGMPFASLIRTPMIVTNHNVFLQKEKPLLLQYTHVPIITISHFQRSTMPELNHIATIYDGIPVERFPFSGGNEEKHYLGFMGRLVRTKGIEEAISTCQQSNRTLKISGIGPQDYIEKAIIPHLSDTIEYVGALQKDSQVWYDFYTNAKALMVPVQWDEPFGLVMTEAMSCGTPILAFARGSIPEIVVDGVTGFIVNPSDTDIRGEWIIKKTGIAGLREAVERIYSLDTPTYNEMRTACRARAETLFSLKQMVDGYCKAYEQCISMYGHTR